MNNSVRIHEKSSRLICKPGGSASRLLHKVREALVEDHRTRNVHLLNNRSLHDAIARQAYYKAARRGFAPGNELQDWIEAEREIIPQSTYMLD